MTDYIGKLLDGYVQIETAKYQSRLGTTQPKQLAALNDTAYVPSQPQAQAAPTSAVPGSPMLWVGLGLAGAVVLLLVVRGQ